MAKKIIKNLAGKARGVFKKHGYLLRASEKELLSLHNKHESETGVLIGMGPSLKPTDLDRFQNHVTFACNKIYLAFEQVAWRPNYYSVIDGLVAEYNKEKIEELELPKIFASTVKSNFTTAEDILFVNSLKNPESDGVIDFQFSDNLLTGTYGGFSVLYFQMQLAYYMGIRTLYLVGTDFSFQESEKTGEKTSRGEDVLKQKDEVNHFHKDYRKPGEKWTIPRLDLQYGAFRKAKEIFEADGGKIVNASRHTKLDVFPLADFDEVFPEL